MRHMQQADFETRQGMNLVRPKDALWQGQLLLYLTIICHPEGRDPDQNQCQEKQTGLLAASGPVHAGVIAALFKRHGMRFGQRNFRHQKFSEKSLPKICFGLKWSQMVGTLGET
jgi:hypothetical protein